MEWWRMKKRLMCLMPSFPVFSSQTSWSQAAQPPELEDREQNEAPIIQGEMVSDLLCHLDPWVHGARWKPPKSAEGAGGGAHWGTFHHLPAVLANWGIPIDWMLANVMPIYRAEKDLESYRFVRWSAWVPWCNMYRITKGSGSARMGLWEAGPP